MNVLVYLMNEKNREYYTATIHENSPGARIYWCTRAVEAMNLLFSIRMDIVIADLLIRKEEGVDSEGLRLLEHLRRIEDYVLLPILIVAEMEDVRFHAYHRLHSYAYFQTPLNKDEFRTVLRRLVIGIEWNLRRQETMEKRLYFRKNSELYIVEERELVRFETHSHSGHVVTVGTEFDVDIRSLRGNKMLSSGCFVRCSRCDYVNPRFIKKVDRKKVILRDELGVIYLTSSGRREVLKKISELTEYRPRE